jgi:hypothetical protein
MCLWCTLRLQRTWLCAAITDSSTAATQDKAKSRRYRMDDPHADACTLLSVGSSGRLGTTLLQLLNPLVPTATGNRLVGKGLFDGHALKLTISNSASARVSGSAIRKGPDVLTDEFSKCG